MTFHKPNVTEDEGRCPGHVLPDWQGLQHKIWLLSDLATSLQMEMYSSRCNALADTKAI